MAEVNESLSIAVSADRVWDLIGDFDTLDTWHPAVTKADIHEDGGVRYRTLTLGNGAVIVESKDAHSDEARSYTYTMTDVGPLPFAEYQATISVKEDGAGGSIIEWVGTFEPGGAPGDEVAQIISGIYLAGFEGVAQHLGGAD